MLIETGQPRKYITNVNKWVKKSYSGCLKTRDDVRTRITVSITKPSYVCLHANNRLLINVVFKSIN